MTGNSKWTILLSIIYENRFLLQLFLQYSSVKTFESFKSATKEKEDKRL